MFPDHGTTKLDLVRYYESVEAPLMRAVGGRPVLMQRFPNGVGGSNFFQKRVPDDAPEWLETTVVSTPNGTTSRALVAADVAHIAWAVNLGCLGFHVWPNHADDDDHADELRIDLDPQPGVGFAQVRSAAHEVRALLDEVGVEGWPKTTGNRGIHVYIRLAPEWTPIQVRTGAVAVARELARRRPDAITDAWWKEEARRTRLHRLQPERPAQDDLRRLVGPGATERQRVHPFAWDELDDVDPEVLTMTTVPPRVATLGDPWEQSNARPQSLQPLLDMYDRDIESGLQDAPWPPVYPKMPGEPSPRRAEPRQEAGGREARQESRQEGRQEGRTESKKQA